MTAIVEVSWATEPGSDLAPNEDFLVTAPGLAIVLDGVTRRPDRRTGCVHGTLWFVRQLGSELLRRLVDGPLVQLEDVAAKAIGGVAARHEDTCDLAHPATPSTTLAILRAREDFVDYLVMADSVIVIDEAEGVGVVTDPENVAVAAADPKAASEAIVGTVPRSGLRRVAAVTDGASRLVDDFGLADWSGLLDVLECDGPGGLIRRVREAERRDPKATWWPRAKTHDDATAVFWRFARVGTRAPHVALSPLSPVTRPPSCQ